MSQNTVQINITADVMEAQAELKSLQKQLQELVNIQNDSLNKFDDRTNQFQEHIKTSIEKVKGNIDQVIGKIEEFKGQDIGTKLQVTLNNTSSALSSFGNMVKTAFVYDVAFQAINKLEDALKELAKQTLEVDSQFEQLKVGIAGQLSANIDYTGSTGKLINEQENFNIAMIKSESVFNKLRQASVNTGIPLEQLGKGFMASVGPATRAGLSTEQLTNFVEKMGTVAKATSIPMNRLGSEIRDLMTGQRSQLSIEMGVTEAWINHHKAVGDLAQAYVDMAAKYEPMVQAQSKTWESIKNKVINSIQQIENKSSEDIFKKLKQSATDLQTYLANNFDKIVSNAKIAFSQISVIGSSAFNTLSDAVSISFNSINAIIKVFTDIFSDAIDNMNGKYRELGFFDYVTLGLVVVIEGFRQMLSAGLSAITALGSIFNKFGTAVLSTFSAINSGFAKMQGAMGGDNSQFLQNAKYWNDQINQSKKDGLAIDEMQKSILDDMGKGVDRLAHSYNELLLEKDVPKKDGKGDGNNGHSREPKEHKKPKGSSNELQLLEEELNKKKIIHEQSIQDEIDFWKSKLKPSQEGLAIYSDIVGKIASLTERQRSEEKSKQQTNIQIIENGLAESKALGTLKVADEVSTWESYLNSVDKGSKEYLAVLNKFNEAKKRLDKENYDNAMEAIGKEKDAKLAAVEIEENALARTKATGITTPSDDIANARAIAQEKYDIQKAALDKELELVSGNAQKIKAINDKMASLNKNYNKEKTDSDVASLKDQLKYFTQFTSSIENSMATALGDYINKTKSMSQAMVELKNSVLKTAGQMVAQFIASQTMQMVKTLAIKAATSAGIIASDTTTAIKSVAIHDSAESSKTAASMAGFAIRLAMEIAHAAMSIAITIGTAIRSISVYIWQAAAAAYASAAAIPYVGWILGPAAAIATVAAVGGMISHVASAEGGYDIPNGVNPMTQLHQNEMVLPAHIAQPLRESLKGGGVGGGHTYNINVQAMDARGVKSFMIDNQDALVSAMKSAHRNSMR